MNFRFVYTKIRHFILQLLKILFDVLDKDKKCLCAEMDARVQQLCYDHDYTYDAFIIYSQNDSAWVIHTLWPSLEIAANDSIRLCIHERDF